MTTVLDFPSTFRGLGFSVVWRPMWSTEVQTAEDGSEYRLGYWSEPLWEFDLVYNVLREDNFLNRAYDEMRQIVGLFNASMGQLYGFKFSNPDDYQVTSQPIGTTDGVSATFDLVRTYGANNPNLGYDSTEHIGFVDTDQPFNLYIDTSTYPVPPSDPTYGYTLSTNTPVMQQLAFNSAPPAGHSIRVGMNYKYYARFKDGSQELEKFLHKLWAMKRCTLKTLRTETLA